MQEPRLAGFACPESDELSGSERRRWKVWNERVCSFGRLYCCCRAGCSYGWREDFGEVCWDLLRLRVVAMTGIESIAVAISGEGLRFEIETLEEGRGCSN